MKMTLLEMVQDILSAMESDDVNSISDTPEGMMVARVIRRVYFESIGTWSTPALVTAFFPLQGLSDVTKPTYMQLPDTIDEIYWLRYNAQEAGDTTAKWKELKYCEPEAFFTMLGRRNLADANVVSYDSIDGVPLYIVNDEAPTYYTVTANRYIICDAFDSAVDATLQSAKTVAGGRKIPTFTMSDNFTPDLDANLFPYLLNEALAVCFVEIKQTANPKAEQASRRQLTRVSNNKRRVGDAQAPHNNLRAESPNFGRKR